MKRWLCLVAFLPSIAFANAASIFHTALETQQISRHDARRLYLLKERTLATWRVQVFRMPLRSEDHFRFVRDVLGMSEAEFDREWARLVNAGLAPLIKVAETRQDMLTRVARQENAVGYLDEQYMVLHGRGSDAVIVRITD